MGFGGHVSEMISRMKYNDNLKKSRRERTERVKSAYNKIESHVVGHNPELVKELENARNNTTVDKIMIRISIALIITFTAMVLIYFMFTLMSK